MIISMDRPMPLRSFSFRAARPMLKAATMKRRLPMVNLGGCIVIFP